MDSLPNAVTDISIKFRDQEGHVCTVSITQFDVILQFIAAILGYSAVLSNDPHTWDTEYRFTKREVFEARIAEEQQRAAEYLNRTRPQETAT